MKPTYSISILPDAQATLDAFRRLVDWADKLQITYAWISSAHGKADHWQALNLDKIIRAIVGIQFGQTEPYALRELAKQPHTLKVINETSGVFHPKVTVGIKGAKAKAILGSSNLTTGGFGGNTELNVLIQGHLDKTPISALMAFIESQWSSPRAFSPDQHWLNDYEETYAKRPTHPDPPKLGGIIIETFKDLDMEWNDFYALIARQERRTLASGAKIHVFDHQDGSFLQEVDRCQEAFKKYSSFAMMPENERKLIGGFGRDTFGWFGWMGGAGYFKQLVNTQPNLIADILDLIPLVGSVLRSQAESYLSSILNLRGVAMGAATRLLAVKRPDTFLPVNDGNKPLIRKIRGKAPASVSGYLALHDRIWALAWYKAPMPDGVHERRVWRARVALLDALLYEIPPDR